MRVKSTFIIERAVEVSGDVAPYRPATRLDPAEGGEVEDIEAELDGNPIELTKDELELAIEALLQVEQEPRFEEP